MTENHPYVHYKTRLNFTITKPPLLYGSRVPLEFVWSPLELS